MFKDTLLTPLSIRVLHRHRGQGLDNDDISRLKGRHEALLASREALGKGANGGGDGDGEDFIPLDGKVSEAPYFMLSTVTWRVPRSCFSPAGERRTPLT